MALILFVAFVLFAVVGRIALHYWLTGDHGVRFAARAAPLKEVLPGSVFVLTFVIGGVLVWTGSKEAVDVPLWLCLAGGAIGSIGIVMTVLAQWQMRQSWRIGVDQQEQTGLVTHGLYASSRNPIYFGILLFWIGVVIASPQPAMFVCALVNWLSIEAVVRFVEEPYLRRVHGEAYKNYMGRTHRYLTAPF